MADMLTAKEMQALLKVDRSTIYRMAEAGQLPAIKVGKQWRFPADQVDNWFQTKMLPARPPVDPIQKIKSDQDNGLAVLLPIECVQLIQETFAELLGVMLVITDMEGNPITRPSNPCGLFQAVSATPRALQRCIRSWHDLAHTIELEPRFSSSNLGLLCSRAMIRLGPELKGMVVAGCIAPENWPPSPTDVETMARQFEVNPDLLNLHLDEVYFLEKVRRDKVLFAIQRIASIVAHIVHERKTLVGRLEAIADLTTI